MDELILDLLEWLNAGEKTYEQVMDAWRTSCPRLTVWEDTVDAGYVWRRPHGSTSMIAITSDGLEHLTRHRPAMPSRPSISEVSQHA